eukprot:scaffold2665_cov160-Chaetoceros_neogracile.AAC.1
MGIDIGHSHGQRSRLILIQGPPGTSKYSKNVPLLAHHKEQFTQQQRRRQGHDGKEKKNKYQHWEYRDIVKRDKDDENYDIVFNVVDLTHLCIPGTRRVLDSTLARLFQMILLAGRGTSPSIPPKPANIPLWKVSLEPKKVSPLPECTYNTKWYPPLRVSRSQPS